MGSPTPGASCASGHLAERLSAGLAFEFGIQGTWRGFEDAEAGPEHGLVASAGRCFVRRTAEALEVRVEARWCEAANDAASAQNSVGVRLGVSW